MACLSTIDWVNEKGESCDRIKEEDCNDRPVNGQSSMQACCKCKVGHKSPTPFKYADKRFAVGVPIYLEPLPRTATRYSVNGDCNLAAYNLTLDGNTGVISYQGSMARPVKSFSVQCEVTAHQGVGLSETVKVSVTAEHMTYPSAVLVFSQKTSSYPAIASGALQDFSMVCAPEQPWLSVDASGTVTASSQASTQTVGAVTEGLLGDGWRCLRGDSHRRQHHQEDCHFRGHPTPTVARVGLRVLLCGGGRRRAAATIKAYDTQMIRGRCRGTQAHLFRDLLQRWNSDLVLRPQLGCGPLAESSDSRSCARREHRAGAR